MGRVAGWAAGVCLLCVSPAFADMIEIRNKGFFNGHILSEDEKEVHFKDTKGRTHIVPRKDVAFLERMAEPAPTEKIKKNVLQTLNKLKSNLPTPAAEPKGAARPAAAQAEDGQAETDPSGLTATTAAGMSPTAMQMLDLAGQAQAQLQVQEAKMKKAIAEADGGTGAPYVEEYDARSGKFGTLSKKEELW